MHYNVHKASRSPCSCVWLYDFSSRTPFKDILGYSICPFPNTAWQTACIGSFVFGLTVGILFVLPGICMDRFRHPGHGIISKEDDEEAIISSFVCV